MAAEILGTHDTPGTGPGSLTVVSGPTAVGKGTVCAKLREDWSDQVWVSVSATTRQPRPGEIDGVHYLFVSDDEFDQMIANDDLLEWAVVHKAARYGTPRRPAVDAVAAGKQVILEIDLQGARQVKRSYPQARMVFLDPPSWDELVRRLVGRGTEGPEERERRLATAREELAAKPSFDHVIVNGEVGQAVDDLVGLLGLQRATSGRPIA
ncbi:guanylate kinase [Propionibacteriaceae bacterium Y1700]|uniref:guanylate kinase n=1 Tax=Microlunatus sp. Y1700 TaxID=3418487 RepID=UPI003DA715BC